MTGRIILALPADTHCGSAYGLMPPSWVSAEGQVIEQNPVQRLLWEHWEAVARRIRDERIDGDRLVIISMGDATEGIHHGIVDVVSYRDDEHTRMHVACMTRFMQLAGFDRLTDKVYYVAGTATHTRTGAMSEEVAARLLEAEPYNASNEDDWSGRYVWPKIEAKMGGLHWIWTHKGASVNRRHWLRGNLMRAYLADLYLTRLDRGQEIPDWVVFAHRHQPDKRVYEGARKDVTGVILPSMKGMDEYTNTVTVESVLNVGVGWGIVQEGSFKYVADTITVEQGRVVEI